MKIACKNIDRLISVQSRPKGMPRDDLFELYQLLDADGPISYQIAQAFLAQPGCRVGIVTGATDKVNFPNGESDGPLGAAALARALDLLGYSVTLYTESAAAMGLREMEKILGTAVPVEELALDDREQFHAIAQKLDICLFTEKLGMNEKGVQHSVTGHARSGNRAYVDWIAWEMNELGKTTIGIGDGGNEVGFGKVFMAARKLIEHGEHCLCGCGGGIITRTATTYLYPVSISNWGCYALCAALAIGAENKKLLVLPEEERAMLTRCMEIGLVDGGTGEPRFALDGVDGEVSVGVVRMIQEMVDITLTVNNRAF